MKGFVIAVLAAMAVLLLIFVFLSGDAPPAVQVQQRPRPIAPPADTATMNPEWHDLDPAATPAPSLTSDESVLSPMFDADLNPATATTVEPDSPESESWPESTKSDAPNPTNSEWTPGEQLSIDQTATSDTSLRNSDYPRTYISSIRVDLTSPNHWVRLTWSGPEAASQERGPFRSSPGRGLGDNDCDDVDESNRDGSNCTPKGTMQVQGFSDTMPMYSHCRYVTWFQVARGIAFHYYPQVPNYPASHGCVRLNAHAAQLIHNNSKIGATEVIVDGKWKFVR
jgi:hypothetical protein